MDTPLAIASFWIGLFGSVTGLIGFVITILTYIKTRNINKIIDSSNLERSYKSKNTNSAFSNSLNLTIKILEEALKNNEELERKIIAPARTTLSSIISYSQLFNKSDQKIIYHAFEYIRDVYASSEVLTTQQASEIIDALNAALAIISKKECEQ